MVTKFFLKERGYGKYKHQSPIPITSKKQLKRLMDEEIQIFDSRQDAFKSAIDLRKGW